MFVNSAHSQARLTHTITRAQHQPPTMGRDFWFCLLTNYGNDLGGKYFALYVTSSHATNVHVQLSAGLTRTIVVQPFKTAAFNIPLAWEVRSSGRVEDMAIHVWSNDAELACHVMCHNAYTSDGFTVIPSIGWGTQYVVAGYAALFEGGGSYVYDLPSEFAVVANQNNTSVTITPSVDLRVESSPGSDCSAVFAQKGVATKITLNKGQCIQLKNTCTQDCDNYDLTGTVVTATKSVGVICGSTCPNIPCDFPYCDHVVEMVPPTRTWGKTYYTVPFFQPAGAALSHSASTFLVVASKDNQKIYRYDAGGQYTVLYCQLNKYQTYWRNDISEGSCFYSDTAFLLVQYCNSASYPDNVNGAGDPFEIGVPAVENYQKDVTFELPIAIGNISGPYANHVNILANANDKHILLDGVSIMAKAKRVAIDGKFMGYRLDTVVASGGHHLVSDSGVGMQVYGYGYDESYGWIGQSAIATLNSPDTTPPLVTIQDNCYSAQITLTDSGGVNTGIYYVRVDSQLNMAYREDPSYIEGVSSKQLTDNTFVLDRSKDGYLKVSMFDPAGNKTSVVTTYVPQTAALAIPLIDFGVGGHSCVYQYDTLVNSGKIADTISSLALDFGNRGFTIDSAVTTPLQAGEHRPVKICFNPNGNKNLAFDTLRVSDGCSQSRSLLMGSGGAPDFYVYEAHFDTLLAGGSSEIRTVYVHNTSNVEALSIDSMYVDDTLHFKPIATNAPNNYWITQRKDSVAIQNRTSDLPVKFQFVSLPSDTVGLYRATWHAHSSTIEDQYEYGWRSNFLFANVLSPSLVFCSDSSVSVCKGSGSDSILFTFKVTDVDTGVATVFSIRHTNPQMNLNVVRQNNSIVGRIDSMSEPLIFGGALYVFDGLTIPLDSTAMFLDTITVSGKAASGRDAFSNHAVVAKISVIVCDAGVKSQDASTWQLITNDKWLQIVGDDARPVLFELVDIKGVTVLSTSTFAKTPIDVSGLTPGAYLYRLRAGNEQHTGKIVIP